MHSHHMGMTLHFSSVNSVAINYKRSMIYKFSNLQIKQFCPLVSFMNPKFAFKDRNIH